jgi:hypothetical protein
LRPKQELRLRQEQGAQGLGLRFGLEGLEGEAGLRVRTGLRAGLRGLRARQGFEGQGLRSDNRKARGEA